MRAFFGFRTLGGLGGASFLFDGSFNLCSSSSSVSSSLDDEGEEEEAGGGLGAFVDLLDGVVVSDGRNKY